jgi:hypothetical protein
MGHLAALWTPETAEATGTTIVSASLGSVAQTISRIGPIRQALNGLKVGSSDGLMVSMKFNPSERSIAVIRGGERVLDAGVHRIGNSILGAGRQVPHIGIGAGAGQHIVTDLLAGIRFIH